MASLVNEHYENEVTLRDQNLPLKCCQPLEMLMYIERGFRSFYTVNIAKIQKHFLSEGPVNNKMQGSLVKKYFKKL